MKFEQALWQFQNELLKEYGPGAEITKIGLPTSLFRTVVVELKTKFPYAGAYERVSFGIEELGELHCRDVQILKRDKEKF